MTIKDFYEFCCHTGIENKTIKIIVNTEDFRVEHYLSVYDIYDNTNDVIIEFDDDVGYQV